MSDVQIDQRALIAELSVAEPIFKREADRVMRETFFDPAVEQLKADYAAHPVTQEIRAGIDSSNISNTLDARFRDSDSPANLFSFIGFEAGSDPTAPVAERLDPANEDGPKLVYQGKDKDSLSFRYLIKAPNETAIEAATSLPWAQGISWVRRIEQGISGVGFFLNARNRKGSRSGGGIQVASQLRPGRFKPTSYLSAIFNNFLRRAAGRAPNGRSI